MQLDFAIELLDMEEREEPLREVGHEASWTLSSCKQSFGISQLRDGLTTTYWQ
jgi:hypothetical protein